MAFGDTLPEQFTPCDRCGWPVDDDDAVTVRAGGDTKVLHSFCVHGASVPQHRSTSDRSADSSR